MVDVLYMLDLVMIITWIICCSLFEIGHKDADLAIITEELGRTTNAKGEPLNVQWKCVHSRIYKKIWSMYKNKLGEEKAKQRATSAGHIASDMRNKVWVIKHRQGHWKSTLYKNIYNFVCKHIPEYMYIGYIIV